MIHVLIDSSIYRKDPRLRRLAFRTLASLCEKKLVTLHVPSIVRRELTTHLVEEAEGVLSEAVKSLKKLSRSDGPSPEQSVVERTLSELKSFNGRYGENAARRFDEWLRKVKSIEHQVKPERLGDVLDRYFGGKPPFKNIKSRDDFPDAFVWQAIKDIATEERKVYAIIADNNLRKAASEIAGVITFSNLEAFIESPTIQDLFPENFLRKNEVEILNTFKYHAWVFDDPIAKGLESALLDTSILHTVDDYEDEADIVDIESVDNVNIDFISAQHFGDNTFRIPFKAGVWAALDYFLLKSTYYSMSNEETNTIEVQDPEWNESTMWVRETRYLNVKGEVGILVDVTELIKHSSEDRLDTDTLVYGSEITVDELDSVEIAAR